MRLFPALAILALTLPGYDPAQQCWKTARCSRAFRHRTASAWWTVALRVDDAEPGGFAYPIVLEASGKRNSRPVRSVRRVSFDPRASRYVAPNAWP